MITHLRFAASFTISYLISYAPIIPLIPIMITPEKYPT